jgi:hypothetical protein
MRMIMAMLLMPYPSIIGISFGGNNMYTTSPIVVVRQCVYAFVSQWITPGLDDTLLKMHIRREYLSGSENRLIH